MRTDDFAYKTEPLKHQVDVIRFLETADRWQHFALFLPQGTGKTKISIDLFENLVQVGLVDRLLVIAPNGVHKQWLMQERLVHGRLDWQCFVWKAGLRKKLIAWCKQLEQKPTVAALAVNIDAFKVPTSLDVFDEYVKGGKTLVLVDEATDIKNPQATCTQAVTYGLADIVLGTGKTVTWQQYRKLVRKPAIKDVIPHSVARGILTGTPEASGVQSLWAMCRFVDRSWFPESYPAFRRRYCVQYMQKIAGQNFSVEKNITETVATSVRNMIAKGYDVETIASKLGMSPEDVQVVLDTDGTPTVKNRAELIERLSTWSYRVNKEDCLDLPEKTYEKVYVAMSKDQEKVYKQLQLAGYAEYKDARLTIANMAALLVRLRQVAGGFMPIDVDDFNEALLCNNIVPFTSQPKIDRLLSRISENPVEQCIVVCAFRAEAQMILARLQQEYGEHYVAIAIGEQTASERNDAINGFISGTARCLVAVESVISRGFNLQNCSTMYFYSNMPSAEHRLQIEDRIHRLGQEKPVLYVDFVTDNTVDVKILERLQTNEAVAKTMQTEGALVSLMFDFEGGE